MARKSITLCKTSEKKIQAFIKKVNEFITEDFEQNFNKLILYDVKNIRDCSEKTIVDFYIENDDRISYHRKKRIYTIKIGDTYIEVTPENINKIFTNNLFIDIINWNLEVRN